MPNKLHLVHVKSSVFDKAPVASDINYGEIAVNYNSGSTALYIRDHADNIVKFSPMTVDLELDTGSTNPVANSAITNVIYENEEIIAAALNDLESRKADKEYVDEAISGITIDVDDHMDSASTNPVQNKVVKEYIDEAVSSITIDIDSELDSGSTNPVANSAVTQHFTDIEYVVAQSLNDINDRKADKSYVDSAVSSITIDVDSELDSGSTNPVENRAIWEELNGLDTRKADKEYVDEAISAVTIDVDEEVDSASTNPVENRAIYEYISEIEEVVSASLNDLETRKADKSYVDSAVSGITIDVDDALSSSSTNPVENRAIYSELYEMQEITSAALNDLNRRKADKSYVDDAVSGITIDVDMVMDSASTNPVANSAVTITILENERVVAGALNDLNEKIAITAVTQSGSGNVVTAATVSDKVLTIEKGTISSGDFVPVADFNAHTGNTDIHVTTAQTAQWNDGLTGITVNSTPATVTNHVASFNIEGLPAVTSADNGKALKVVNGVWTLVDPVTVYSGSGTPQQSLGDNGDIYLQTS